jgi:hypothetical protein
MQNVRTASYVIALMVLFVLAERFPAMAIVGWAVCVLSVASALWVVLCPPKVRWRERGARIPSALIRMSFGAFIACTLIFPRGPGWPEVLAVGVCFIAVLARKRETARLVRSRQNVS